ncbi:MAG: hypothetical protein M3Q13_01110 [Pseudomonadota bacterium]|nr:hypothetical protein [Pseudomonadota bacterium]
MAKTPWKLPMWLLAFDEVATILFALGLHMPFAPGSSVSSAFAGALSLPLMVAGGMMSAIGVVLAVRMVLAHLNH